MPRKFLTREDIDRMLAEGKTAHQLGPGDVVTAYARDHARSKGLQLIPASGDAAPVADAPEPASGTPATRAKVRTAVIAALGRVPENLDQIIDKAMKG